MRPPNSRHSDPRNSHMPSLVLERPVLVANPWPPWTTSGSGAVTPPSTTSPGAVTLALAKGSDLLLDLTDLLGVGLVALGVAGLVAVRAARLGTVVGGGL